MFRFNHRVKKGTSNITDSFMKIKCVLYSVSLFMTIFSSCKKDDGTNNNNNNNNSNDTLQLASLEYDFQGETQKQTFSYNTAGLINRISSEKWPAMEDSTKSQPYYTIEVEWFSDNTLSRIVNTMAGSASPHTLEFLKDPVHQLVRKGFYPITAAFGSETWLGLDYKGRVIADSNYAGGIVPVSNYKVLYWDANDNLIKIDNFISNNDGTYTENYTIECTYDQNKNPLYTNAPYFFAMGVGENYDYQSKNNLLQEKLTFNGSVSIRSSYTYEYNQQGYPTKRILTSLASLDPGLVKYVYK